MIEKYTNRIPPFLKNKYLIAGVAFVIWIVFLDNNNIISQIKLQKELNDLKRESRFYKNQTMKDSVELHLLNTDSIQLEKVGREKYLMKRDSEDIYLIVREPKSKN